jgi:C4-type Zn-finger protein
MIEIEVEIDTEVPAAEVQGIEEQLSRLEEVAEMQMDWRLQAEAQDEVERLLRAS